MRLCFVELLSTPITRAIASIDFAERIFGVIPLQHEERHEKGQG